MLRMKALTDIKKAQLAIMGVNTRRLRWYERLWDWVQIRIRGS